MKTFFTLLLLIPLITFGQLYGDHEVAIIKGKDGITKNMKKLYFTID